MMKTNWLYLIKEATGLAERLEAIKIPQNAAEQEKLDLIRKKMERVERSWGIYRSHPWRYKPEHYPEWDSMSPEERQSLLGKMPIKTIEAQKAIKQKFRHFDPGLGPPEGAVKLDPTIPGRYEKWKRMSGRAGRVREAYQQMQNKLLEVHKEEANRIADEKARAVALKALEKEQKSIQKLKQEYERQVGKRTSTPSAGTSSAAPAVSTPPTSAPVPAVSTPSVSTAAPAANTPSAGTPPVSPTTPTTPATPTTTAKPSNAWKWGLGAAGIAGTAGLAYMLYQMNRRKRAREKEEDRQLA